MVIPKLPPIQRKPSLKGKTGKRRIPPTEGPKKGILVLLSPSAEEIATHLKSSSRALKLDSLDASEIVAALESLRGKERTEEEVALAIAFFLEQIKTEKPETIKEFLELVQDKMLLNQAVIDAIGPILATTEQYKHIGALALGKFISMTKEPSEAEQLPKPVDVKALKKTESGRRVSAAKAKQRKGSAPKRPVDASSKGSAVYERTKTETPSEDKSVEANYNLLNVLMESSAGGPDSTPSELKLDILKALHPQPSDLEKAKRDEEMARRAREKEKEEKKLLKVSRRRGRDKDDDESSVTSSSYMGSRSSGWSTGTEDDEDRRHHRRHREDDIPADLLDRSDDDEETRARKAAARQKWLEEHTPGLPDDLLDKSDDDEKTRARKAAARKKWLEEHTPGLPDDLLDNIDDDEETRARKAAARKKWIEEHKDEEDDKDRRRHRHRKHREPEEAMPDDLLDRSDDDEETKAKKAATRQKWLEDQAIAKKAHRRKHRGEKELADDKYRHDRGKKGEKGRHKARRMKGDKIGSRELSYGTLERLGEADDYDARLFLSGKINQKAASTAARNYFSKSKIDGLFSLMMERLLLDRPDQPIDYLIDLVRTMRVNQEHLKSATEDVRNYEILGITNH